MQVLDRWADNDGVRLHYLESPGASPGPELLYIPGVLGTAEDFVSLMPHFQPSRCLSVSLRGRGKGESPNQGYTFEDQVADLEAVIATAGARSLNLLAFSMGVPLAVGYALRHPQMVHAMILCDYPARYPAFPPDWADRVSSGPLAGRATPVALRGLQRESRRAELWDQLGQLGCPVLVVRGGREGSRLSEEEADMYVERLPRTSIALFEDATHEVWEPDDMRFIGTVKRFLADPSL